MKLHWSSRSPYVRKVMAAAIETGTNEHVEPLLSIVTLQSVNDAVMADNPLGKIPTLISDGGECWFDSLVICEYLNQHRTRCSILPESPGDRLKAMRWHALGSGLTDLLVLWNNERNRPAPLQSPAHLQAHARKVEEVLDYLEQRISTLDSEAVHIGHLAVGSALGYADFRFPELAWSSSRLQLARWFRRVDGRESFQRTQHYDPAP